MGSDVLLVYAAPVEGAAIAASRPEQTLELGVGKARAAATLAGRLARERPRAVLAFGVCGCFPAGHGGAVPVLDVGSLVWVAQDAFGDEGVVTEDGFLSIDDLGLGSSGPFAADEALLAWGKRRLPEVLVVRGVTVSSGSGTDAQSKAMAARSRAHVETMEGAAIAMVCQDFGVPWLQLRCVSNRTGHRAAAGWALDLAASRTREAMVFLLEKGVP